MTISPVTGSVGTTTQITATIKDTNGNPVSGGKVIFKVNGITLKDESGNQLYAIADKGRATINATITKSWYKDNLKIEAVYTGSKYYQSARANNTTTRVGETLTLTPLFTDNYKNKINNTTAQITI